jgi:hypothetical protein
MSWTKREAVTNLVILGDEQGHKKKAGGLLVAVPRDKGYPDKFNYVLVQQDGEEITLSGSASLARQLNEQDIGKFVKCEFTGWGRSNNGKFKMIDVNVWEGEPTDVMKEWPRFTEFHSKGRVPATTSIDWGDDFPGALQDEENDLPFD